MESGEETFWLCKVNQKLLELIERLVIAMERTQMLPRQEHREETCRVPEGLPKGLLTVSESSPTATEK